MAKVKPISPQDVNIPDDLPDWVITDINNKLIDQASSDKSEILIELTGTTEHFRGQIIRLFGQHGWTVTVHHSSKNEAYLKFKANPTAKEVEDFYSK